MIVYILLALLFAVGLAALLGKRNLLKKILGLVVIEHAVNLFLVLVGYRSDGAPPILMPGQDRAEFARTSVDPVPQALVLTSIVIGLALVMLMVALVLRIQERHGTLDSSRLTRLHG